MVISLEKNAFTTTVGKGESASNHHSLLFQKFFLPYQRSHTIGVEFNFTPPNALNLEDSKI